MQHAVDPELVLEARRYRFRFTCQDCQHVDAGGQVCSHGYPNRPHLDADLRPGQTVEFCKEFELW